jgi:translation initiation factor 3 subunit C
MSRFFQASDSDSETSSSSEEDIYSEEDEAQFQDESDMDESEEESGSGDESSEDEDDPAARRSKFLKGAGSSDESDEEEGKRVVKSARDKRWLEIESTIKVIENGGKINDWVVISNGMTVLGKNNNSNNRIRKTQ